MMEIEKDNTITMLSDNIVSGVFTDARASAIIRTDNNGNQRRYMYPMWKEKTRIDIPSVAVSDPFPIENYVNATADGRRSRTVEPVVGEENHK